jgi:hypothetical protein
VLLSLAAGLAVGFFTRLIVPDEFALAVMFIAGNFLQVALLLLVFIVVILARKHYRNWFAIPRRIGGSWMLAAGGMLLAVLITSPDKPIMVSGTLPSPLHDPNQPHIHGANDEIIYLPTGKGGQPATAPNKLGAIEGVTGRQLEP